MKSATMPSMTAQITKSRDKAWDAAIAQAQSMTLPDYLWERPQVQGFTIDGPTSKDLDDAIWIEETQAGAIASVHITDVAELVKIGSAVDKVALARTQTRYFAWGNDPMIPHVLSENLLSLWDGQRRPTLTVKIRLNQQAEILETEIFESWLISQKKLTYERGDRIAKNPQATFHKHLKLCQSWANKLNQKRESMGAFGGIFSKTGFLFDEDGNVVTYDKFCHSQIIIQEFMILANQAVAQWFADHELLALYRNHTAREIVPERKDLMNALLTIGNTELIRTKLRNWLNKATYDPTLIGHFALNLPAYCHFTSPIRRLPDVINHRIIKATIHGKPHPYSRTELEQLCEHIRIVTETIEEKRVAHFKERAQKKIARQLQNPEDLDILPEKEFTKIIEYAIKDRNFEPVREIAIARLKQDKLTVKDFFLLLVNSRDKEVRQAALADLKGHVEDAPSIIAMGLNQKKSWEDFEYLGEGKQAPFTCWAAIMISGSPYTTIHPAQESKKQRSRQLACFAWLEAFVNQTLVAPEQREIPKPPVIDKASAKAIAAVKRGQPKPSNPKQKQGTAQRTSQTGKIFGKKISSGGNMVGLLFQFCQAGKFPDPIYEVSPVDDGFVYQCQITALGQTFSSEAIAKKKQHSRRLAAKAILEQVQEHVRG